jgi:hypothetical protein
MISLTLVGATVICIKSFYNPHFGEKLLRNIGNTILKKKKENV